MQLKEMNKALNAFGKYVVQQARTRLTKNKAKKKIHNTACTNMIRFSCDDPRKKTGKDTSIH